MTSSPPRHLAAREDVIHDVGRLNEIAELELLSPEVDEVLCSVVDQACAHFDLPVALVSIVLDDTQYFAAQHGLSGWMAETNGMPIEWSFCQHVVTGGKPLVVEDATRHELVKTSPAVELDGIRCYAGVPLVSSRGFVLGSFCVVGIGARSFTEHDLDVLRTFAATAMQRIEQRAGRTSLTALP